MQTQNNLLILAKMKKCRKNMIKLQDKIDFLTTIIDQQSVHLQKDLQFNIPPLQQKPEIIISDEASVEIVLSSNEPEPINNPPQDLKLIAKKLISRFYYHIREKMKEGSLNQLQALKLMCNKQFKDNPYKQLYQGFQKLYITSEQKCKQCNISFSNVSQSANHVLHDHLNDLSIFICIQCKLTFQNQEKLDNHILQQHNPISNLTENLESLQQHNDQLIQKQTTYENNRNNQNPNAYQISFNTQPQPIMQKVFIPTENTQSNNHVKQQDSTIIQQRFSSQNIKIIKQQQRDLSNVIQEEQQSENIYNSQKKPNNIKIKIITKTNL